MGRLASQAFAFSLKLGSAVLKGLREQLGDDGVTKHGEMSLHVVDDLDCDHGLQNLSATSRASTTWRGSHWAQA